MASAEDLMKRLRAIRRLDFSTRPRRRVKNPLLAASKPLERNLAQSASERAYEPSKQARPANALLSDDPVGGGGCTCGRSYCEIHGTDHRSDDLEMAEFERRMVMDSTGCRGGRRVERKAPPA